MDRVPMTRCALSTVLVLACLGRTPRTHAEVRSCTVGIDVNCPSGLSE